ncbi:hypothetical protein ERK18_04535 [Lactobacillus kimbladii]|uniref:restriction endonuclease subunit S n=1 Tax=Lactobacillus kimbladii TaxID=1218506 RepID=UPI00165069CA|nr:restriction endonuclease subunit S [Lactobacillus kimbladii]MBC6342293.1 hypothetical protein [Lactobacillus kimbladii]
MNEHNSVPNMRFKGFEDEWKVIKINYIVNIKAGGDLEKNKLLKDGKYPVIGNTLKNNGIIGYTNTFKIEAPAVTVTGRGEIGKAFYQPKPFTPVVRLLALVPKSKNIDMKFLSNEIENLNFFSESTGVPQLTAPELGTYKVGLTECSEQQEIGNLFDKLEKLLDLQQHKIDKLELLKKALLKKLFPNHDDKIPELRFNGFEVDWKEKKLSHLVDIIMGQSPSSTNYFDTPIENSMILIQGNADIKHHNVKPRIWTTQITKIAMPKDVLLTVRAPVGEVAKNEYKAVIGRGMAALRGNYFLYYNLEKLKVVGYWERLSTGSTFESISSNDISDAKIKISSFKEQKKIYNFLSKVDQLIELENKKLQDFQQVKKCLLQNMFVE